MWQKKEIIFLGLSEQILLKFAELKVESGTWVKSWLLD